MMKCNFALFLTIDISNFGENGQFLCFEGVVHLLVQNQRQNVP